MRFLDKYGKAIKLIIPIENIKPNFVEKITKIAKKSKEQISSYFLC